MTHHALLSTASSSSVQDVAPCRTRTALIRAMALSKKPLAAEEAASWTAPGSCCIFLLESHCGDALCQTLPEGLMYSRVLSVL